MGQAVWLGPINDKSTDLFRSGQPDLFMKGGRPNHKESPKRAQMEDHAPNPKAAQAYREKGGSLEDKMTSPQDKDKIR